MNKTWWKDAQSEKNEQSETKRPENDKNAGFSQKRYHHRFQCKELRRFVRSILFFDRI